MLIAIIFFLLLVIILAGFIMGKRGVRTAYIWMLLTFVSFIAWLILIIVSQEKTTPLILSNWFEFGNSIVNLRFVLNSQTWILAISLLGFNLSFLLTSIARLNIKIDLINWLFQIALTMFSFMAVVAGDLWTVVLIWTLLDILDIVYHQIYNKEGISYFRKARIKFLGSILLIWNISVLSRTEINPLLNGFVSITDSTLFLSALLHSGIFPFESDSKIYSTTNSSKLLDLSFRVANFLISFAFIYNLPIPSISFLLLFIIKIVLYIVIFYSLIRWALNQNYENSLNFLLLGEAGIFSLLYISGGANYLIYSLAILPLSVLWLGLFSHSGKALMIFPVMSIFFISGLPLSINAYGPRAFIGPEFSINQLIIIFAKCLFLFGYLNQAFQKKEELISIEKWYQAIYLIGLFIPLVTIVGIITRSFNSIDDEIDLWWIGILVVASTLIGYGYLKRSNNFEKIIQSNLVQGNKFLWKILNLGWLFDLAKIIETQIKSIVNGISKLLEGEGGILWAIVLLLLVFSVLR